MFWSARRAIWKATAIGSGRKNNLVLIRQKESYLLTKLVKMLRVEERRPEGERDHELIATINRIWTALTTASFTEAKGHCDQCAPGMSNHHRVPSSDLFQSLYKEGRLGAWSPDAGPRPLAMSESGTIKAQDTIALGKKIN
jgi:hypothetical protein